MTTFIAKMDTEDLNRFRAIQARIAAIEVNPRAYSASETEMAYMAKYRFDGEIAMKYEFDPLRFYLVSTVDGTLAYGKEWLE